MLSVVDDFEDDLDEDDVVVVAVVVGVVVLVAAVVDLEVSVASFAVPLLLFEGLEDVVEELLFFSGVPVSVGTGDSKNAFRASAIDFFVGVGRAEGVLWCLPKRTAHRDA